MDKTSEVSLQDVATALNELVSGVVGPILVERQGMSLTSASTLRRLEREGPSRLTALAAAEGIAQPSMTAMVQRLESQGLALRLGHPEDGRVRLVAITDAGRALLAERRRVQSVRMAGLLTELPEHELRALGEAVRTALPIVRRMVRAAHHPSLTAGGAAS
ncbi:MarR family winged helix-turn-helix transcriptional regulator [Streptomyces sp. NPDC002514]|uniref:MarR family winged helix-turn-helix transcriptional regulator n=1 Tax=Streptomyces sp. NPDC001270 TaxID=3364554 RepID=UPI0036931F74